MRRLEAIFHHHAQRPNVQTEAGTEDDFIHRGVQQMQRRPKLGIPRSVFVAETMDVGLPEHIATRFYRLFNRDSLQNNLPWKHFVRGMVLFLKGTVEEKGKCETLMLPLIYH